MKAHKATDESAIQSLLEHLNACHDGTIRRISFLKDRKYDDEGNVFYPSEPAPWEEIDPFKCDIEIELLLNDYRGASPAQVVLMRFEDVRSFRFIQEDAFDYSDVFEVLLRRSTGDGFEFVFRVGLELRKEPVEALQIVSPKITCTEV